MADEQMWIGNKGREQWIACPKIDADVSRVGYQSTTDLLSGEVSLRQSANAHRIYNFEWKAEEASARQYLLDLADGHYNDGTTNADLIYFGDPTTMRLNGFPPSWAAPFLQTLDAPSVLRTVRPTAVATTTNTARLPARSAQFPAMTASNFRSLYIPIPPGWKARWAFWGNATSWPAPTSVVTSTSSTGANILTPLRSASAYGTGWSYSDTGSTGMTFVHNSVESSRISAACFQAWPTSEGEPAPPTSFVRGWGNAGCVVDNKPSLSIGALARYTMSARLIEVGARR